MPTLTRQSAAKINLTLRVGPPRPDGFHEIESLVARVGLCDTVGVAPRADGQLTLECDDPAIPRDETNLALRAARLLADQTGVTNGAHISLRKRIPAGSGLGGGSSNAATALMLLNDLWQLRLGRDELAAIGAQIGSDVPLFFHSPLCIVRGRGEQIEDVNRRLEGLVLLILPDLHVSTREVYAAWDRAGLSPARPSMEHVLAAAGGTNTLGPLLFNDLEAAAFQVSPELAELVARLRRDQHGPVHMTGSGSAFFQLLDKAGPAHEAAGRIARALGVRVEVVPLGD
jgi:4-diphosphocytidyl-2-C-methyl-D-erythritol kinase